MTVSRSADDGEASVEAWQKHWQLVLRLSVRPTLRGSAESVTGCSEKHKTQKKKNSEAHFHFGSRQLKQLVVPDLNDKTHQLTVQILVNSWVCILYFFKLNNVNYQISPGLKRCNFSRKNTWKFLCLKGKHFIENLRKYEFISECFEKIRKFLKFL